MFPVNYHHCVLIILLSLTYFSITCCKLQVPHQSISTDLATVSSPVQSNHPVASGVDLRILPLGDSITYGEGSHDGNGYRLALYNMLIPGNHLDYIGRVKSGTMADNDNEGHRGYPIGPIGNTGKPDYPERPNVVLLMAGTNDVVLNVNLDDAHSALSNLINQIVTACPDAAVLVATLTPLLDPGREARRLAYNSAIPGVVAAFTDLGKQVAQVDLRRVTTNHINATDGIHPNDAGYGLIASAWYEAILAAGDKGWIKAPLPGFSQNQPSRHKSQVSTSWTSASEWTMPSLVAYGVFLLAVVVAVRKIVITAIRTYRS